MLNVVCVLWQGDFRKRTFSPEWVGKLQNMVERNLPIPHNFYCLSNVEVPCDRIPLKRNWPGWWATLEVYSPDLPIEGRIIYFDLDSLIIKDLSDIATFDSKFALMHAFGPSENPTRLFVKPWAEGNPSLPGKVLHKYSTCVRAFDKGQGQEIYTEFNESIMQEFRGDQDWVSHLKSDVDLLPREWFCKLRDCMYEGPNPDIKLVCSLPYKNDQAAELFPWVKKIWV